MENTIQTRKKNMDKFVRYADGAQMYHVSVSTFMQWATLVDLDVFEPYFDKLMNEPEESEVDHVKRKV